MSAPETPRTTPSLTVGLRLGLSPQATSGLAGRHVLVIGMDYAPDTTGIAPYTTGLAEHLASSAAGVTVLTGVPRHPDGSVPAPYLRGRRFAEPAWRQAEGPHVIRVRHRPAPGTGSLRRAWSELGFLVNAVLAGRRRPADVVIGVTPSPSAAAAAAYLARRRGARLITVVQGTTSVRPGGRGDAPAGPPTGALRLPVRTGRHRARRNGLGAAARLVPALERYALRHSDEIAVASEAFRPVALAAGVDPRRLHLLPNWTRLLPAGVSRQSAREALGWPLDQFAVVHAGPMGPWQDLGTVLAAARLLALLAESRADPEPDRLVAWDRAVLAGAVRFVLVGEGSQRAALEQQAFGLDNVRFLGPVDDRTQALVLAAADVLLVAEPVGPGARATAGLLSGYLSAGRPVLAAVPEHGPTDSELRRSDGAGVRVDPGDPGALADALLRLQSAPQRRGSMGRAALRYAQSQLGRVASLRRLDLIVDAALADAALSGVILADAAAQVDITERQPQIDSVSPSSPPNGRGTVGARSDGPFARGTRRGH